MHPLLRKTRTELCHQYMGGKLSPNYAIHLQDMPRGNRRIKQAP